MRPRRTIVSILTALLLLLASTGLALADGDEDENENENEERGGKGKSGRADAARGRGEGDGDDGDDRRGRGEDRGRGHGKPSFVRDGGDKWLLQNDHVSVWFHTTGSGKAKPQLRVFHTDGDGNVSGYAVSIKRLVEFGPDGDSDDEDENETGDTPWDAPDVRQLNRFNLAKSNDWNVQTEEDNGTLHVTMVRAEAQGIVTLVFHVNTTSPGVKFDLKVDNWAWADNASANKLALVMVVHEKALERRGGSENVTLDGGYITWAPTADLTYGGGINRTANVTAWAGTADDEDDDGKNGRLVLVFDAPGGYESLDYDPEFGVLSTASIDVTPVPATGAMALLAVAGVAALAAGVRRGRRG